MDVTLYWWPESSYSQRVILALYEKKVPFKDQLVQLQRREHVQPWFVRLNPKCLVPVIQYGNDVIRESDDIINYLSNKLDTGGSRLVPDVTSPVGEEIAQFRNDMNQVRLRVVTFGVLVNPALQVKPILLPTMMAKGLTRKSIGLTQSKIAALRKKQKTNPNLSGEIEAEIEDLHTEQATVFDTAKMSDILDDLEQTFDRIALQLEKTQRASTGRDYWLFGDQFTAADISLAIILRRIYLVGLDERYFSKAKRPLLHDYFTRLCQRPAYQMMVAKVGVAWKQMIRSEMTAMALKVVKMGVWLGVAAAIILGVRRYLKLGRG